jgi:excinuclease ABC subunit C
VKALFPDRRFAGFGPTRLSPDPAPPPIQGVTARRAAVLRARVRERCPRRPGVYSMVDRDGRLIYVGKAKCLRSRLLSYFREGSREAKAGRIIDHTRAVVWEFAPSEFAALLRELELIRRWRPAYNVLGLPGRQRFSYVCLGRKPAPYLFLARQPTAEAVAAYGPIPGSSRAAEAVRRLNDGFKLRDCTQAQKMRFAEQGELFPIVQPAGCLRYEIGTCVGPCAAYVTRAGYAKQVRAARAFLEGRDVGLLTGLERDMAAAAAALEFERAAALRDKLEPLQWLHERLVWLQRARDEHTFVYPLTGDDGRTLWYLIHRGRVRATVLEPADPASRRAAQAAIETAFPQQNGPDGLVAPDQIDSIMIVAGWFRRHPDERACILRPADALALCEPGCALRH